MSSRRPHYAVILAGGKGTRMRSADRHKVCFPVDGRPAINRALETYRQCGVRQPIVVVGAMAEQVMATVSAEHEGVIYVYQADQLGTGHAARLGLQAIGALGDDADVLVVAGDRLIEPIALERLIELYYDDDCDLAFMAAPRQPRSEQGRVLLRKDGTPLACVEMRDVRQRRALARVRRLVLEGRPPYRQAALTALTEEMDEAHAAAAFGDMWSALADEGLEPAADRLLAWAPEALCTFSFQDTDGRTWRFTPDEVESAPLVNVSVYLGRASALIHAIGNLSRDNAQQEEYLSDVINLLARASSPDGHPFRVRALRVDDPNHVLGFNNPAELLEVEAYFRQKRRVLTAPELPPGPGYRTVDQWIAAMKALDSAEDAADDDLAAQFVATYGDDDTLLAERRRAYLGLLEHAATVLGADTFVFLVRAPGRVNILGRHIDHQGGNCNLMAIDREILMAVHPREDDRVRLLNVEDGQFATREFSISEMLSRLPWDDWLSLVNSDRLQEMLRAAQGDWSLYVQAAILRLQKRFPTVRLRGMDVVVHGNIPIGAGLSSSSALVVAAAQATVIANRLEVLPSQFVDLCGEGEWYVGTRGGSADHAAMVFGQRGKVARVRFYDFGVDRTVDFPADHRLVICNSLVEARKAAGARDIFNHRVACYRIGLQLILTRYEQYAPLIRHLRDVNVRNLRIPLSWIYRILLSLPERATPDELARLLPPEILDPILATHSPQEHYPVRGVVLFGLAEAERSRLGADLLAEGRVEEFGRLMRTSHDGDRVVAHSEEGEPQPYYAPTSSAYLLDLMADLESGDPGRVLAAQLHWQPGSYRCSTEEIDLMVDLALSVPGVAGAQLAGAGLGGCMMVLAREDAVEPLRSRMIEGYYAPRRLTPDISVCTSIAGSGAVLDPRHPPAG